MIRKQSHQGKVKKKRESNIHRPHASGSARFFPSFPSLDFYDLDFFFATLVEALWHCCFYTYTHIFIIPLTAREILKKINGNRERKKKGRHHKKERPLKGVLFFFAVFSHHCLFPGQFRLAWNSSASRRYTSQPFSIPSVMVQSFLEICFMKDVRISFFSSFPLMMEIWPLPMMLM